MERSVFWLPPVYACEPRVSSAVVPPNATHHPKKKILLWDHPPESEEDIKY